MVKLLYMLTVFISICLDGGRNQVNDVLTMVIISFIPAFFLSLFNFTDILHFKNNNTKTINTSNRKILDINLLNSECIFEETNHFWLISRIFSSTCLLLSLLLFSFLLTTDLSLDWGIILPCLFFIISVILWLLPKIGSWIFAFSNALVSISILCTFLAFISYKPLINLNTNIDMLILFNFCMGVLGLSILCISLTMLLLSKEAQQEWKR